jgi:SP family sugar:H+ symporter-like MFS transporter
MKLFKKSDTAGTPPLTDLSNDSTDREKRSGSLDESRVPWVTWRSVCLGAFVSIGGVIFGYDTGQISGFLEMRNYKQRFGQLKPDGTWKFSNVRSGLIVSMVSGLPSRSESKDLGLSEAKKYIYLGIYLTFS